MKHLSVIALTLFASAQLFAQVQIPIPPAIQGTAIDLTVQQGVSEIFQGTQTNTIGYNGALLGPTLLLQKGQSVTMNVHNQLSDTTTVHWHGLHVAPMNDGGPHTPILAGESWSPSFQILDNAATYWYHPHPHGKTMQQVLKGAAGFIIVHDEEEAALKLPGTYGTDDIPLVFQWKSFDNNHQIVNSDETDNEVLINGVPRGSNLNLPAQIVRLRLLNGSSHRYFYFGFVNGLTFKQIAGDAGLLDAPLAMSKLMIAPGERAEILLDLSGMEGQSITLQQYGTQLPQGYPGGQMMNMGGGNNMMGPLDNTNFDLMKITVTAPSGNPVTSIPAVLTTNTPYSQAGAGARTFSLSAQPMMSMTNFFINGLKYDMETINFSAQKGKAEIWTLTNQTMMAHPFHVHGNAFYVLSVDGATPPANMRGRKDVVTVPPMGGSVKIIVRFDDFSDSEMPYMYHCHILSHEDTGMMGQFLVQSASSGTEDLPGGNSCPICVQSLPLPAGIDLQKVASTSIFDLSGKLVLNELALPSFGQAFDVSGLPKGVYVLKMLDRNGKLLAVQRFIKQGK